MLQVLISKIIGIAIVGLSFTFKLPQIITMIKEKTAEGLSEMSCMTDILVYLSSALYAIHLKLPFSVYGENIIILTQSAIILILFYAFTNRKSLVSLETVQRFLFTPVIIAISYFCIEDKIIPENIWQIIASSPIIFISISKISQILTSFRLRSTGPLSPFTSVLGIVGPLSRMFTLIVESGDMFLIGTQIYSIILNTIVLVQIIMYKKQESGETPGEKKKK